MFDGAERSRRNEADELEDEDEDKREAIFQFLSQNETLGTHPATDEEKLQQILTQLKREFLKDLEKNTEREPEEHENLRVKYPKYTAMLNKFSEKFNQVNVGFRRLTCMPTFMLGLVMASRVQRHYQHAPWFRVGAFNKMAEVHGAVSDESGCRASEALTEGTSSLYLSS